MRSCKLQEYELGNSVYYWTGYKGKPLSFVESGSRAFMKKTVILVFAKKIAPLNVGGV